ncbi:MAG: PAS domain S-box protein [Spirochaetaceae bacterium]|jgi:PAS domain S-box-containing protein|nr:PAS domain S-box protein [Spirochaetaceae bacterium]
MEHSSLLLTGFSPGDISTMRDNLREVHFNIQSCDFSETLEYVNLNHPHIVYFFINKAERQALELADRLSKISPRSAFIFVHCQSKLLPEIFQWEWSDYIQYPLIPQEIIKKSKLYVNRIQVIRYLEKHSTDMVPAVDLLGLNHFGEDSEMVEILGREFSLLKRMKQSEELFRIAFNTSPDSININRLSDGLYVDINQGFTKLTGYTRKDVWKKTSADIQIWQNLKDREKLVQALKTKGECENLQAEFRLKDGSTTTALMSAKVIHIQGVPHILSITRDISDRIKTRRDLERVEVRQRNI